MAVLNLTIPSTPQNFYNSTQSPAIAKAIAGIYAKYQSIIDNVSSLTHVPSEIINSFIFIESAGDQNARSGAGAIGLMQLIPTSASDILVIENTKKRLSAAEKAILIKNIGADRMNALLSMKYLGQKVTSASGTTGVTWITANDLVNPETNILIGSLYLGQLIDEETNPITKDVAMHKVVVRYNKGYFADNMGKNIPADINTALGAGQPLETKNYILKLLGRYGTLYSQMA